MVHLPVRLDVRSRVDVDGQQRPVRPNWPTRWPARCADRHTDGVTVGCDNQACQAVVVVGRERPETQPDLDSFATRPEPTVEAALTSAVPVVQTVRLGEHVEAADLVIGQRAAGVVRSVPVARRRERRDRLRTIWGPRGEIFGAHRTPRLRASTYRPQPRKNTATPATTVPKFESMPITASPLTRERAQAAANHRGGGAGPARPSPSGGR